MTLEELSKEYQESAEVIRLQLKVLRNELKTCEDPCEKFAIKMKIRHLEPILTDIRKVGRYCARYYEKGFYIGSGPFGAYSRADNGRRDSENTKAKALAGSPYHITERINTATKRSGRAGFNSGVDNIRSGETKKRKSVHNIKKLSQGL